MASVSIRLRPTVSALLEQRCKEAAIDKSQLVNDLIEQALGGELDGRRAAAMLDELLAGIKGSGSPDSARNISRKLKKTLRAKYAVR